MLERARTFNNLYRTRNFLEICSPAIIYTPNAIFLSLLFFLNLILSLKTIINITIRGEEKERIRKKAGIFCVAFSECFFILYSWKSKKWKSISRGQILHKRICACKRARVYKQTCVNKHVCNDYVCKSMCVRTCGNEHVHMNMYREYLNKHIYIWYKNRTWYEIQ